MISSELPVEIASFCCSGRWRELCWIESSSSESSIKLRFLDWWNESFRCIERWLLILWKMLQVSLIKLRKTQNNHFLKKKVKTFKHTKMKMHSKWKWEICVIKKGRKCATSRFWGNILQGYEKDLLVEKIITFKMYGTLSKHKKKEYFILRPHQNKSKIFEGSEKVQVF